MDITTSEGKKLIRIEQQHFEAMDRLAKQLEYTENRLEVTQQRLEICQAQLDQALEEVSQLDASQQPLTEWIHKAIHSPKFQLALLRTSLQRKAVDQLRWCLPLSFLRRHKRFIQKLLSRT